MINVYTVTGRLGTAPEKRQAGPKSVTSARLAVSQGKDKPTIWFSLDAWEGGFAAPDLARCQKGQRVTVTGRLQMREHEGREYYSIRLDAIEGAGAPKPDERDGDGPQGRRQPAASRQPSRETRTSTPDDWAPRDEDEPSW